MANAMHFWVLASLTVVWCINVHDRIPVQKTDKKTTGWQYDKLYFKRTLQDDKYEETNDRRFKFRPSHDTVNRFTSVHATSDTSKDGSTSSDITIDSGASDDTANRFMSVHATSDTSKDGPTSSDITTDSGASDDTTNRFMSVHATSDTSKDDSTSTETTIDSAASDDTVHDFTNVDVKQDMDKIASREINFDSNTGDDTIFQYTNIDSTRDKGKTGPRESTKLRASQAETSGDMFYRTVQFDAKVDTIVHAADTIRQNTQDDYDETTSMRDSRIDSGYDMITNLDSDRTKNNDESNDQTSTTSEFDAAIGVSTDDITGVEWWTTFIMALIFNFYHQRDINRSQFGVLFMGNIHNLNNFPFNFYPHNADGTPVIDNRNPISPASSSSFGNYITSRPENVQHTMIHAEDRILTEMNDLWNAYYNRYHMRPNLLVLYSWIMPCQDCTGLIINHLNQDPYRNVQYRIVSYTVEGTNSLSYMTPAGNAESRERMRNNSLVVYRQRCNRPSYNVNKDFLVKKSGGFLPMATHSNNAILDANVDYDPGTHTCKLQDTFQGCMVECLGNDLCCSCKNTGTMSMNVAMVNLLAKECATSPISKCANEWIQKLFSGPRQGASSCTRTDSVTNILNQCVSKCEGRSLSKPLDPHHPGYYPGYLTTFSDIFNIPKVDLTDFCEDMRADGPLCTTYRSDSFTAGNTLCRSDNRCGYNDGKSYSWCYVDFSNSWDYCCTSACNFGKGTNYMWCSSGSKWQYCGSGKVRDVGNRACLAEFPCGMHQEYGGKGYYWCYVDLEKNWGYCCEPWTNCNSSKWCYTGYKKETGSKWCRNTMLPPLN